MKNRLQSLIKFLKYHGMIYTKVGIPREFYNDLQIYIELCARNGISVTKLFTFVFGIGYELFMNFFNRGDIKSMPEMLCCVRFMRNMFDEIMEYHGKEWFMDSKSFKCILKLCKEHNEDPCDFFDFIDQNKSVMIGDEKLLLTSEKVEAIFEYYLRRDIQTS